MRCPVPLGTKNVAVEILGEGPDSGPREVRGTISDNLYSMNTRKQIVGLTGCTGYIGGRLLPLLEERHFSVRCLVRRPEYLISRIGPNTSVVYADALDRDSLMKALEGVGVAYYLIHSLGTAGDFEAIEYQAAENFAAAAKACGVRRIIYLGGLAHEDAHLSTHLRSRLQVGHLLRSSGAQVIEFRASVIIGSGSLSFELIRALVERLPVMICPKWVFTPTQPIAVEDVLEYLLAALHLPDGESQIFEIGGPDQVSYGDIMLEYARQRGLRRIIIPVPLLTPRLSSLWLGLVTPVYARIGRKLVDGLRNATVVRDHTALEVFPIRPRSLGEAISRALINEDREFAATRWSDSLSAIGLQARKSQTRIGNRIVVSRTINVPVPVEAAFAPIRRIGGQQGWYSPGWLWHLRGLIDLLVGGVGMRRGRPNPQELRPGDPVDFWRVERYEPNRRVLLAAEMRLPGRAWLDFEVEAEEGISRIRQTVIFEPLGLLGLCYWYALYLPHQWMFGRMLKGIARAAREYASSTQRVSTEEFGAELQSRA